LFDESHNLINTNNIAAVEYVSNFEREMRKFRAGVVFATQSPQEMVPEGAASTDVAKLKTIFELTQFKTMFNLDDSLLHRMRELLGDSLTDSEYAAIPDLEVGQAIMSLGSKQSYRVKFLPSERQLKLFDGQ
jgi:DNA helicase HerA-like ATPase